jgi:hypothetical protein
MESEGSPARSEGPATGRHSDPDEYSPQPPALPPDPFQYYSSERYPPSGTPKKIMYVFLIFPYVLHSRQSHTPWLDNLINISWSSSLSSPLQCPVMHSLPGS